MREVSIGYYAHHHGSGHLRRAMAIANCMDHPVTIFSSATLPDHVNSRIRSCLLPLDIAQETPVDFAAVPSFHYAPTGLRDIAGRMSVLAKWFRAEWPCLLVVDVSVEVALFARLCSVPTIYIRQNGERDDLPHELAYGSAEKLVAPFPKALALRDGRGQWEDKTIYTGFICRFANPPRTLPSPARTVVVLIGHGGTNLTFEQVRAAAVATPDWHWSVLGPLDVSIAACPANVSIEGIIDDPRPFLSQAMIVVGSAGDSVVAEMAVLRCRYIAIPEVRPFDEQVSTACALMRLGVAISCPRWPDAGDWPALLQRASLLDTHQWDRLASHDGAMNAARAIRIAASTWQQNFTGSRHG